MPFALRIFPSLCPVGSEEIDHGTVTETQIGNTLFIVTWEYALTATETTDQKLEIPK